MLHTSPKVVLIKPPKFNLSKHFPTNFTCPWLKSQATGCYCQPKSYFISVTSSKIRRSYRDLSSQTDRTKENLTWSYIHISIKKDILLYLKTQGHAWSIKFLWGLTLNLSKILGDFIVRSPGENEVQWPGENELLTVN